MANFQTHLNIGILVSGATVLTLHGAGLADIRQIPSYFVLGVAGSLLPDIDADNSRPVRGFFNLLGALLAFAIALPLVGRLLPLELGAVWAGVFLGARYGVFWIFSRLTVHRGIWHSWLAIAFAVLATVNTAHWLLEQPARLAWLAGLMVGIGYLTHLLLDEFYSVDLFNRRVRRSFGTALKPFSPGSPCASLAMLAAVVLLAWPAPATDLWGDLGWTFDHLAAYLEPHLELLRHWWAELSRQAT